MSYIFPAICWQWDAKWFELWLSHLKCCGWLLCYPGLLICVSAFKCWRFVFLQEKLYQWILRQQEEGSRVTTVDIVSYLQVFFFQHPFVLIRLLSLVVLGCLRYYFMAIWTLECFCSELLICYPLCQTCASGCFLHPHVELDWSAMTIENLVSSLFDILMLSHGVLTFRLVVLWSTYKYYLLPLEENKWLSRWLDLLILPECRYL